MTSVRLGRACPSVKHGEPIKLRRLGLPLAVEAGYGAWKTCSESSSMHKVGRCCIVTESVLEHKFTQSWAARNESCRFGYGARMLVSVRGVRVCSHLDHLRDDTI